MKIIAPTPFYFDNGNRAVILLHSLSGTPNDMRLLGRYLQRSGYSAYAPMFAGHGTREPLDILNQGTPAAWWQQVHEAIDFLKGQGKTEFYVFGLSLGAIFATKAVEELPEVSAGGVFGSPLYNRDFKNILSAFKVYAQKVYALNELDDKKTREKLEEVDQKIDPFLQAIQVETSQITDNLKNLAKPYFIGQGTFDDMVDQTKAKTVASEVSQSDLHYYEAGHVLTINHAHKQLQSDVLNFLEKIEEANA